MPGGKWVAYVLTPVLAILICGPAAAEDIVLGEIASLSGQFAKPGGSIHQGVEVAVLEANREGGIGGRAIRLVVRDDAGDPMKAIESAEYLCLKEKALALTGGYVDSLVGPVAEVAEKYRVPYVAAASLQSKLTRMGREYFFRISNLEGYVKPIVEVISATGARRSAIIHPSTPGATELASLLSGGLGAAGLTLTATEIFRPGTSDFTPTLLKLLAGDPEVVISLGFFQDNLLMVKQLKENRLTPALFLGAFGMEYQSLVDDLGADAEHLVGTTAWEPGMSMPGTEAAAARYRDLFKEKFGLDPEPLTMHGYVAARVVIDALRRLSGEGKALSGTEIRDSLRRTDLLLPMERVKFDPTGEPLHYSRFVFQIVNGRHVTIYPPEVAASKIIFPSPSREQKR